MTIGERIKQLRKQNKMTQTELADAIGTTKQNIYKYENGVVTNIPSDRIKAIARYFNVSPAYLMGWHEPPDNRLSMGEVIKEGRLRNEMTQEELANELGYKSPEMIEKIEGNKILAPASVLYRISQILKISITDILFDLLDKAVVKSIMEDDSENQEETDYLALNDNQRKRRIEHAFNFNAKMPSSIAEIEHRELVQLFDRLNQMGKVKVIEYLYDLNGNEEYSIKTNKE